MRNETVNVTVKVMMVLLMGMITQLCCSQNILNNPSFENGLSQWTDHNSISESTNPSSANVCEEHVAWINPNTLNSTQNYISQSVPAAEGGNYQLTFNALDVTGAGIRRAYLQAINSQNRILSESFVDITGGINAGFNYYSISLNQLPSSTSLVNVRFEATHTGSIQVDCVSLERRADWQLDCGDAQSVTSHHAGINGSENEDRINLPDPNNIIKVITEVVYKGNNPGEEIMATANGNTFPLGKISLPGNSSNFYVFRGTYFGSSSSIELVNAPRQSEIQSMSVYAFRNGNQGINSSGNFFYASGYRTTVEVNLPIPIHTRPRDVNVEVPVSEFTYDCRVLNITVTAGQISESVRLSRSSPSTSCCIEVPVIDLLNVPGNVNSVNIVIESPSGSSSSCPDSGSNQNGQSFIVAGAIFIETECSSGSDFGDAPSSYGDICYAVDCGTPARLGNHIDAEEGSQYSAMSDRDDNMGLDDEDGIFFSGGDASFYAGVDKSVSIDFETYDAYSYISAWVDWNKDGLFNNSELVMDDVQVGSGNIGIRASGTINYGIKTPGTIACGTSYLRVIISNTRNDGPTGLYGDQDGCNDGEIEDYMVHLFENIQVVAEPAGPLCEDADPIQLMASPSGGIFSGNGVSSGGLFTPSIAGVGSHEITYTFTDETGCSGSDEISVNVHSNPEVYMQSAGPFCLNDDPFQLQGTPIGGTYSGQGVSQSGSFNPMAAGVGEHAILYSYTDENNCTSIETQWISVFEPSVVTMEPLGPLCQNSDPIQIIGNPNGGTYWIEGEAFDGSLDPQSYSPGLYNVEYVYVDGNNCSNSTSMTVEVIGAAKLGDYVWLDVNNDGCQDEDEPGMNDIEMILYSIGGEEMARTYTSEHPETSKPGWYQFEACPGDYYIIVGNTEFEIGSETCTSNHSMNALFDPGTRSTGTITIVNNEILDHFDVPLLPPCVKLGGRVWFDDNVNDLEDNYENGINGIPVLLWKRVNGQWEFQEETFTGPVPSTPSDDGYYKFCVLPGEYHIQFFMPPNSLVTVRPKIGSDETIDSDVTDRYGLGTTDSYFVTIDADTTFFCDIGAGYYPMGTAGDHVWIDVDGNGFREPEEPAAEGILVEAFNINNHKVGETTSDVYGRYRMEYLKKDPHYLKFTPPDGLGFTFSDPQSPYNRDINSDVDHSNGPNTTQYFMVRPGVHYGQMDAGLIYNSLPVEWLSFKGKNQGSVNLLNWSTAQEFNTLDYQVMRKSPQEDAFVLIGVVDAAGYSSEIKNYQFIDDTVNHAGVYLYQLKQVDQNGDFDYSDVIKINVESGAEGNFKVFPNPAVNEIYLKGFNEMSHIGLYDISGVKIKDWKIRHTQSIRLTLEDSIPAGIYHLKIEKLHGAPEYHQVMVIKSQ